MRGRAIFPKWGGSSPPTTEGYSKLRETFVLQRMVLMGPCDNPGNGHHTDPNCGRTIDPDMGISNCVDLDVIIALDSISHQHRPSSSLVPGLQHGPILWQRPQASEVPFMVI